MEANRKLKCSKFTMMHLLFSAMKIFLRNRLILGISGGIFLQWAGYDPILPYATDPHPINVWYTNDQGQKIYFQGLFVQDVKEVPDGYRLKEFPASDFLVVTTEWMESNEEAVGENGNGQCNRYADTVQIPEGYIRNDGPGSPITAIEKKFQYA